MFISNSPRLFAGNHVLLRLSVPRHSPYALFRLNSLACSLSRSRVTRSKFRSCLSFANNCLGCNEKTVLSNILHHRFPPPGISPRRRIVVPSFGKTFYCLPNYNYLFVSFLIRFSMNNRFFGKRLQMQTSRSRSEGVLRTPRGREREEKKHLNEDGKIRRILSSFFFSEKNRFCNRSIPFSCFFALR